MIFHLVIAVLAAVALAWCLPLMAELLTLCASLLRSGSQDPNFEGKVSLLFLVPAHNEETLIESCVESLMRMRSEQNVSEITVVADNCTDQTAARATAAGARVLERHDPERRGKPAAVEWARRRLDTTEQDAIVIIDADTIVDENFADALARKGPLPEKFVQAYFGVRNPRSAWLSVLGNLLMRIRYEGQYPVKARAGLSCPLTGNGMCMGTRALERVGWPNDSLTENWELYARSVVAGIPVDFQRKALLYSEEAESMSSGTVQRRRWQSGRWDVAKRYTGAILSGDSGLLQKIDSVVELAYPSPVVHVAVASAFAVTAWLLGLNWIALLFVLSVLPIMSWTIWAWATSRDKATVTIALLRLPIYALWRLKIWAGSLFGPRDGAWIRSPRTRE